MNMNFWKFITELLLVCLEKWIAVRDILQILLLQTISFNKSIILWLGYSKTLIVKQGALDKPDLSKLSIKN